MYDIIIILIIADTTWCQKWWDLKTIAMASLQLQPPECFNFKRPDEWPKWSKRFEQFRVTSGLSTKDDTRQVCMLLYCLGEEAEDVLKSTNITEEERKVYATVLGKFDIFFQVRKNVIFKRARFNRRPQLEGEMAEQYIAVLYNLTDSCNFGALKGEIIRDRLVVGIRDSSLSECLQLDANLMLEKAKIAIRQKEAVQEQQGILNGDSKSNPITLDAVKVAHKVVPPAKIPDSKPTRPAAEKRTHNNVVDVAKDPTNENSAQQRMLSAISAIAKDILVPSAFREQFLH